MSYVEELSEQLHIEFTFISIHKNFCLFTPKHLLYSRSFLLVSLLMGMSRQTNYLLNFITFEENVMTLKGEKFTEE